ncbi:hypothetical protein F7725_008494 [Xyrichtys novacula]|uniref:Ig-like domain-containing protein n=1 Tax=Xyrichtys novacula TaxID=13765 RepID=A0AAV1GNB0_XYRNO|nr:hypothetical protein F7725_008494 [Xyrichtys novacula]
MDTFMKLNRFILSVFILWTTGRTNASDVDQTASLWRVSGDNATIHCNHSKGSAYYQMYWYRQLPGQTMKPILNIFSKDGAQCEPNISKEKFGATKPDAHKGTLTVRSLQAEDGGTYFCAVSGAQRCRLRRELNKNLRAHR